MLILPASLLDELSRLPASLASPHGALEEDLLGPYTGLDIILDSRLHHTIVQRKLTPRLGILIPALEEELMLAMSEYITDTVEWTKFQPYQIFAKIGARLSSRALVGERFCRDQAWLTIAVEYTENLFRTIGVLRLFPAWLRPLICPILPSYWRGRKHMRDAEELLYDDIDKLLQRNDRGEWSPQDDIQDLNVLHLLAGAAKGNDRKPRVIAHVEVLLALASVHTILLRMVNVLYDIMANPELIEEINAEIADLYQPDGTWLPSSYEKLYKLDSILRESQRVSPPTTLGLKRKFKADHTFSSGLHIPSGTYVCLPTYAIENDPRNRVNTDVFDGLRTYRLNEKSRSDEETGAPKLDWYRAGTFSFASVDTTNLGFGYGKHACPGRFFASLVLKMFFLKLLSKYEFKFLPGSHRPSNYVLHEFMFCWPWTKVIIRSRALSR